MRPFLAAVLVAALAPTLISALTTGTAPPTLRVDLTHFGNATSEQFAISRVVVEPLPWPGSASQTLDDTNLGKYRFEVVERSSQRVLYSRGFASIYGEWETTADAAAGNGAFEESLRFPRPAGPVQLRIQKRDRQNDFREVFSTVVDPDDLLVNRSKPPSAGALLALQNSGPSSDKVDFLILGDGYRAVERDKCEADARRLMALLFEVEPFKSRRADFNVWGLCPESVESGISRPSLGIHKRSPVGTTYDAFRSERYVLSFDNRAFRDLASQAPYMTVYVLSILASALFACARSFATVWLGLTLGCARCHDHKFDPIPIKDYYSLYGVFASSTEPKELPLIGAVKRTPDVIAFEKELEKREVEFTADVARQYQVMGGAVAVPGDYLLISMIRHIQGKVPVWNEYYFIFNK